MSKTFLSIKTVLAAGVLAYGMIGMAAPANAIFDRLKKLDLLFIPDNIEPLFGSVKEEYCVAPLVVKRFGSSELSVAADFLSAIQEQSMDEEDKKKSLFCRQNIGGVVLVTDRSINSALEEAGLAITEAGRALDLKTSAQQAALARIARLKNLSLGEKLQPEFARELNALDRDIATVAADAEERLGVLAKSGGITPEIRTMLTQAHRHFVNFRYHQGKAISGITIFEAARGVYGNKIILQAFQEALKIDQAAARKEGRKAPKLQATERLVTAFIGALPKFAETMFTAGGVSKAIWEAADTADFESVLEDLNEPSSSTTTAMVSYASNVNASASDLGLPGVASLN